MDEAHFNFNDIEHELTDDLPEALMQSVAERTCAPPENCRCRIDAEPAHRPKPGQTAKNPAQTAKNPAQTAPNLPKIAHKFAKIAHKFAKIACVDGISPYMY